MNIDNRVQRALEVFHRYSADAKIVVLHPTNRLRNVLLASLVGDPVIQTFYYSFDLDDTNLLNFITSITHEMSNQHPLFGRHINLLKSNILKDPYNIIDDILRAFVRELSEMHDGEFYFILDEFDRADRADDVQRFIERLSHFCRIVASLS